MRRNKRKRTKIAASKLLVLVALFVARGAWAAVGSDHAAPSSATLESHGSAHHLVWEGVNFEVSGKSSGSGESHSSSGSTRSSRYQHLPFINVCIRKQQFV